jgi:hypothetical protein
MGDFFKPCLSRAKAGSNHDLTIKLANVALNYWRLNNIEINKAVQSFNCYNYTEYDY